MSNSSCNNTGFHQSHPEQLQLGQPQAANQPEPASQRSGQSTAAAHGQRDTITTTAAIILLVGSGIFLIGLLAWVGLYNRQDYYSLPPYYWATPAAQILLLLVTGSLIMIIGRGRLIAHRTVTTVLAVVFGTCLAILMLLGVIGSVTGLPGVYSMILGIAALVTALVGIVRVCYLTWCGKNNGQPNADSE